MEQGYDVMLASNLVDTNLQKISGSNAVGRLSGEVLTQEGGDCFTGAMLTSQGSAKIPLPPSLSSVLSRDTLPPDVPSLMGILDSIQRCWATVENVLYIWDYNTGEVLCYDELDQPIQSVGIAVPTSKSGSKVPCFKDSISHLLVVTTPVEIVILAASYKEDTNSLSIHSTPFSTSTDNVRMLKVEGAADGRIFMAGNDGLLYELVYECTRNTLSHYFGLYSEAPSAKCQKVSHNGKASVLNWLPPFLKVITSDVGSLVDITIDSRRGYLYTLSTTGAIQVFNIRDNECDLVSKIRCSKAEEEIVSIHSLLSCPGVVAVGVSGTRFTFVLSSKANNAWTEVQCIPHPHMRRPNVTSDHPLSVTSSFVGDGIFMSSWGAEGVAESISGIVRLSSTHGYEAGASGSSKRDIEISTVVGVSDDQVHSIVELRAVAANGYINNTFTKGRGLRQNLISTQHNVRVLAVLTRGALHLYHLDRPLDALRHLLLSNADKGKVQDFIEFYGHDDVCRMVYALLCGGGNKVLSDVERSTLTDFLFRVGQGGEANLRGLGLFVAKTLEQVWNNAAFHSITKSPLFNPLLLSQIHTALHALFHFLQGEAFLRRVKSPANFTSIRSLVERCKQMALLLKYFASIESDRYDDLWKSVKDTMQHRHIQDYTFKVLVNSTEGESLARHIAVNYARIKLTGVDGLALKECSLFFSPGDWELQQALQKFESGETEGALSHLQACAADWAEAGVVDQLSLKYAVGELMDAGKPHGELPEAAIMLIMDCAYHLRQREEGAIDICYAECLKLISKDSAGQEGLIKLALKRDDDAFHYIVYQWLLNTVPGRERESRTEQKQRQYTDLFTTMGNPIFVESFLSLPQFVEGVSKRWTEKDRAILLYKCLQSHEEHNAAALQAQMLSEFDDDSLKLNERIAYLNRAIMHARRCSGIAGSGFDADKLRDYENRLKVAEVQLKVHTELVRNGGVDIALEKLNTRLLNISELYNDYAARLHLEESALAILHISDLNAPDVVEKHWTAIIDKVGSSNPERMKREVVRVGKGFLNSSGEATGNGVSLPPVGNNSSAVEMDKRCFPLKFLITKLLSLRDPQFGDAQFIASIFHDVSVDHRRLVQACIELQNEKPSPVILELLLWEINDWERRCYSDPNVSEYTRCSFRETAAKWLLPWISGIIVTLGATGDRGILKKFRELEEKLKCVAQ